MLESLHVPFHQSYWVVPGKLLAGYYPGDPDEKVARQKLTALYQAGIRYIINLMEEDEVDHLFRPFKPYNELFESIAELHNQKVGWQRFPIQDLGVPTRRAMVGILNEIDSLIESAIPVYVHCWGGIGRTGTVVGCYLARHGVAHGKGIIAKLAELRRVVYPNWPSPQSLAQHELVRSWQLGE
jgi:hypothetical protein